MHNPELLVTWTKIRSKTCGRKRCPFRPSITQMTVRGLPTLRYYVKVTAAAATHELRPSSATLNAAGPDMPLYLPPPRVMHVLLRASGYQGWCRVVLSCSQPMLQHNVERCVDTSAPDLNKDRIVKSRICLMATVIDQCFI